MNPGYLSYVAFTLAFILIAFGFKSYAIGHGSPTAAMLFFVGWIAAVAFHWTASSGASGTFAYIPLLALAFCALRRVRPLVDAVSALSYGLLLGAVVALVQLLEAIDPLVILLHPLADPVLLLVALVVGYSVRNARLQIGVVSVAWIVSDLYTELMYMERHAASFGGRAFQDAWWMTVFGVRLCAECIRAASALRVGRLGRLLGLLRPRR